MSQSYRDRLFASYHATHIQHLDSDDAAKRDWFVAYARANYLPVIGELDCSNTEILELACNKGFLLHALATLGFQRLRGIDLSPDDVAQAQQIAPHATIIRGEALQYLNENLNRFDVIMLKALLEHVPKDQIIRLLEAIKLSLRPGGIVLIDVPNMDWIAANHERYMDFTHETGFTRESLAQVMRTVFADVLVRPSKEPSEAGLKGFMIRFLRPVILTCGRLILRIIGEGASEVWWHCRSIIATGKKE
jgi:2-polyprenyl-3-methyl-5-hydroxy-6-metoxy-1,4-benzoquinol methylase